MKNAYPQANIKQYYEDERNNFFEGEMTIKKMIFIILIMKQVNLSDFWEVTFKVASKVRPSCIMKCKWREGVVAYRKVVKVAKM